MDMGATHPPEPWNSGTPLPLRCPMHPWLSTEIRPRELLPERGGTHQIRTSTEMCDVDRMTWTQHDLIAVRHRAYNIPFGSNKPTKHTTSLAWRTLPVTISPSLSNFDPDHWQASMLCLGMWSSLLTLSLTLGCGRFGRMIDAGRDSRSLV
jgi:hypothetical protein